MSNLAATISGQFSKSLILGTFLPSALFVILAQLILVPLLPADWAPLRPLEALDTQWQLLAITLLVIVLSGLLYNLNIPIIRFFEGYPWKDSWLGHWRIGHYQELFATLTARSSGMRSLVHRLSRTGDKRAAVAQDHWIGAAVRVKNEFPDELGLILPTRLGNIIRSFEYYPRRQYGMDAVNVWPRLVAVIDKDYAGAIDNAKTALDFMLNITALSGLLALATLLAGLIMPERLLSAGAIERWLGTLLGLALLAGLAYHWSLGCAASWGRLVRGAFDLFRWKLLEQLGYQQRPATINEEYQLWQTVSMQMIYGYPPQGLGRPAAYSASKTFARGNPELADLTVTRRVVRVGADGLLRLMLEIHNPNTTAVTGITVVDTLPPAFDYAQVSALLDQHEIGVSGTNPYKFAIGDLQPDQCVKLHYTAIPRTQG